jgi:hypothetical protein
MASTIFSGNDIKTLKSNLDLNGNAKILSGNVDPSQSATSAPLGSLYLSTLTGLTYKKGDAGSSTNWTKLGSGQSNKNYILFGDFENNSTQGWSIGHTALTNNLPSGTSPTFGSGASGNQAITVNSSPSPLSGLYSLNYTAAISTATGDLIATQPYTIDIEDRARVLSFKFSYNTGGPVVGANFSGTSSNSFGVAIWDVVNTAWIIPTGCFNLTQTTGTGICQGTFQTPSNMTQFRLVIFNANATSGSINLELDSFYVGPQSLAFGPPMTDPALYPAAYSNFGTIAFSSPTWQRRGKMCLINFYFVMGTGAAAQAKISLPTGVVPDFTNLATLQTVGKWSSDHTPFSGSMLAYNGDPTVLYFESDAATGFGSLNGNAWAAGTAISGWAEIPVAGWSANTVLSADSDTRLVGFRATSGAATSITSASNITIPFTIVASDTHAGWNGTDTYTVPVSGRYRITAAFSGGPVASSVNGYLNMYLLKNGSQGSMMGARAFETTASTYKSLTGSTETDFNAGDTIQIRATNQSGNTFTLNGTQQENYICITRQSGNSVVAASESVNSSYSFASFSCPNSAHTTVNSMVKIYDSHSAGNTNGNYTVPVTGKYRVTVFGRIAVTSLTAGGAQIFVNGGTAKKETEFSGVSITGQVTLSSIGTVSCVTGDVITVALYQTSSGTASLTANAQDNYVDIERVGN